jgi:hypothetical protein
MEMQQLEAIWADSSTQWNFDFEHRNEIQSNMNDAFNAQAEQIFAMQVIIRICSKAEVSKKFKSKQQELNLNKKFPCFSSIYIFLTHGFPRITRISCIWKRI